MINMEIKDNHEEALIAGQAMLELCQAVCWPSVSRFVLDWTAKLNSNQPVALLQQIEEAQDLDAEISDILDRQEERHPHQLLHAVSFY